MCYLYEGLNGLQHFLHDGHVDLHLCVALVDMIFLFFPTFLHARQESGLSLFFRFVGESFESGTDCTVHVLLVLSVDAAFHGGQVILCDGGHGVAVGCG